MEHRHSHTQQNGKAKCLHYRNSKRCGRVAKFLVNHTDHQGYHHQAVCEDCKDHIVTSGGQVVAENAKGFTVRKVGFGRSTRTYTPIE